MAGFALTVASSALAESYYAINLTPVNNVNDFYIAGSSATLQAGYLVKSPGDNRAVIFNGSPVGMQLLIPLGFTSTMMSGTNGSYHVGLGLNTATYYRALRWNATTGAVVDLTPAGFTSSGANDIAAGTFVGGWAGGPAPFRAHVWSGTTAYNLHPVGADHSIVFGVHSANAVGSMTTASIQKAVAWFGTSGFHVVLHPATGYVNSIAHAISSADQVGYGFPTPLYGDSRALRWTGTAASCISLHPAGYAKSAAYDTNGSRQVGHGVTSTGVSHALFWRGTAATVVNLNTLLPALGSGFGGGSYATTVNSAGDVAGHAFNSITGRWHPILWKRVP